MPVKRAVAAGLPRAERRVRQKRAPARHVPAARTPPEWRPTSSMSYTMSEGKEHGLVQLVHCSADYTTDFSCCRCPVAPLGSSCEMSCAPSKHVLPACAVDVAAQHLHVAAVRDDGPAHVLEREAHLAGRRLDLLQRLPDVQLCRPCSADEGALERRKHT